jgi:hypothetical protein
MTQFLLFSLGSCTSKHTCEGGWGYRIDLRIAQLFSGPWGCLLVFRFRVPAAPSHSLALASLPLRGGGHSRWTWGRSLGFVFCPAGLVGRLSPGPRSGVAPTSLSACVGVYRRSKPASPRWTLARRSLLAKAGGSIAPFRASRNFSPVHGVVCSFFDFRFRRPPPARWRSPPSPASRRRAFPLDMEFIGGISFSRPPPPLRPAPSACAGPVLSLWSRRIFPDPHHPDPRHPVAPRPITPSPSRP